MKKQPLFVKESDLCAAYIAALPEGWTSYAETGGWDILLSRNSDGFQIGIQAKLKFNADVVTQALEEYGAWAATQPGPDCRAVLVPQDVSWKLGAICSYLGLTIISVGAEQRGYRQNDYRETYRRIDPPLPGETASWSDDKWHEWCPAKRVPLPAYVPDVVAGAPAPSQLTDWKIRAIKIAIIAATSGYVLRSDFKAINIDHRRWIAARWLVPQNGRYVKGDMPDFKAQHPRVYAEILADIGQWLPKREALI
ncbi:MAG: hypothetical protein E6Q98_15925 [Rhodospirillaceae bacterium]|nr:MAG: hypothetical protein E6Q98_15925 [Rhodospirillaceae bacterium]